MSCVNRLLVNAASTVGSKKTEAQRFQTLKCLLMHTMKKFIAIQVWFINLYFN